MIQVLKHEPDRVAIVKLLGREAALQFIAEHLRKRALGVDQLMTRHKRGPCGFRFSDLYR